MRCPHLRSQNAALTREILHGVKITLALVVVATCDSRASAETKTFKNSGLKNEIIVRLEAQGKDVTGTFASSEYGNDTPAPQKFSGKIVDAPKGKIGVYMRVRFDGDIPYSPPPGTKDLIWHLKIVNHRAHLFIPMQERSYEGKTPRWVVSDVELEPVD